MLLWRFTQDAGRGRHHLYPRQSLVLLDLPGRKVCRAHWVMQLGRSSLPEAKRKSSQQSHRLQKGQVRKGWRSTQAQIGLKGTGVIVHLWKSSCGRIVDTEARQCWLE